MATCVHVILHEYMSNTTMGAAVVKDLQLRVYRDAAVDITPRQYMIIC